MSGAAITNRDHRARESARIFAAKAPAKLHEPVGAALAANLNIQAS
jgi:hypothetical protein